MSLADLLAFEPRRLHDVRVRVQADHPTTAELTADSSGDALEELKRLVLSTQGLPERIKSLAFALSPRQRRQLVLLLGLWEDQRPLVADVLLERLSGSLALPLWRLWQHHPTSPEVKAVAREFGDQHGWAAVVGSNLETEALRWHEAPASGPALLEFAGHQGIRVGELTSVSGAGLQPDTPLMDRVWVALLMLGTSRQFEAEERAEIRDRATRLSPEEHRSFGAHYLNTLYPPSWDEALLESVGERYHLPGSQRADSRFWDSVAPDRAEAFRQWFLERALEEFFGGGSDRHVFWRAWLSHMRDARKGMAGSTPYGILDFGSFVVVEFFEVGNAAYFYAPEQFALVPRRPRNPGDLKQRSWKGVPYLSDDNRLIHRPGWQPRGSAMVRSYLR